LANVALENHIRTFGLDRVTDLLVLNKKFPTKSFDVNAYYKDCFGIIRPEDEEAQDVVLSFTKLQGRYVKNYPLHHSQKVISETEHETVISVHVFCTFDFVQELLSHRELLKIISPLSLLEEIQEVNKKIAENHPKNGPI
ncbi:MAG: helix-turn-helix transcriptional regulator, partial [Cytophagales bacterium]